MPTSASHSDTCPICHGELKPGGCGKGAPAELGGFPLRHCPACQHTCCPAACAIAADYDALYGTDYAAQQVEPLRDRSQHAGFALLPPYARFFKQLGPASGRNLLDVGCGAGRFLIAAKLKGWNVRGIEPSAQAVAAAGRAGLWLPITAQTPEEVEASGARFDVVTLFDVLEHVADPAGLLRSVLPLLKPGGSLFITVPNWECRLMQQATRADWLPPVHLQFFSQCSLIECVDAALAAGSPAVTVEGYGVILSDPAPPVTHSALWFRWLSRRVRGHEVHAAQLWLHARPH